MRLKLGTTSQTVRVGTFEVFSTHFLRCLAEFFELENFELHEFGPGRLEQALAEGRIDIGITYLPIPKAGIEYDEVAKIRMGLFGLSRYQNRNWQELPFVLPLSPLEGTPSKVMGLDGWPDQKYPRRTKARVSLMESALELCRMGACVGYFPEFVIRLHNSAVNSRNQLVELNSPIKVRERQQEVFLMKRVGVSETPTYRRIARALRSLE
jgi:DNA-binding transcriptional LysR family regulator